MLPSKYIFYYHNIQHINDYPFDARSGHQLQIHQDAVTLYEGKPLLLEILRLENLGHMVKKLNKNASQLMLPFRPEISKEVFGAFSE